MHQFTRVSSAYPSANIEVNEFRSHQFKNFTPVSLYQEFSFIGSGNKGKAKRRHSLSAKGWWRDCRHSALRPQRRRGWETSTNDMSNWRQQQRAPWEAISKLVTKWVRQRTTLPRDECSPTPLTGIDGTGQHATQTPHAAKTPYLTALFQKCCSGWMWKAGSVVSARAGSHKSVTFPGEAWRRKSTSLSCLRPNPMKLLHTLKLILPH